MNSQSTKRGNIIISLVLLTCSCSVQRYSAEDRPEIGELTLVAPYSRMYAAYPEAGLFYADTLSEISARINSDALFAAGLPIVRTISVEGRPNQEDLDAAYEWIKDVRTSKLGSIRIPAAMQAYLSVYSTRFAVLLYSEGFLWAKTPVFLEEGMPRYDSRLYLCIADSWTGKIIYYNRSEPEEADPVSVRSINRRISYLLKGYDDR